MARTPHGLLPATTFIYNQLQKDAGSQVTLMRQPCRHPSAQDHHFLQRNNDTHRIWMYNINANLRKLFDNQQVVENLSALTIHPLTLTITGARKRVQYRLRGLPEPFGRCALETSLRGYFGQSSDVMREYDRRQQIEVAERELADACARRDRLRAEGPYVTD